MASAPEFHLTALMTVLWSGTWQLVKAWGAQEELGPISHLGMLKCQSSICLIHSCCESCEASPKCQQFSECFQGLQGRGLHLLCVTGLAFSMHRTPLTHLMKKELNNLHLQKHGLVLLSKVTSISPLPSQRPAPTVFLCFSFRVFK